MKSLVLLILFVSFTSLAQSAQVLTSPLLTNWGTWGDWERCPAGSKVISVQTKTEVWNSWDMVIDDTCSNGIKFTCGDPRTGQERLLITSKVGQWGRFGNMVKCNGDGFVRGFMLRTEEASTAFIDETATNNIRILCSGSESGFIELDGERWGQWTNPRICADHEYVCGLQTQVEDSQGAFVDDTSLNNIRVECCDLPLEDLLFYQIDVKNKTVDNEAK